MVPNGEYPINLSTEKVNLYKGLNNRLFFTKQELFNVDPELSKQIGDRYLSDSDYRSKSVVMKGLLEAFASKVLSELIDENKLNKACALAYCSQIQILFPLIANNRDENGLDYFKHLIELYNEWRTVLD